LPWQGAETPPIVALRLTAQDGHVRPAIDKVHTITQQAGIIGASTGAFFPKNS
jgi:hypothetical protein